MHPSESSLALYAGGDLAVWSRWRVATHLRGCEACRRQVEELRGVREWMRAADGDMPEELDWDLMAREMRANIRVGLAAGECVASPQPAVVLWKPALALPLVLVLLAGWLIQSWPRTVHVSAPPQLASFAPEPVLEASPSGIGLEQDGSSLRLLHPRAGSAVYSVSGSTSVGSRYVDAETNYVTISHVYAQ